jgi:hypothetical protein
MVGSVRRADRTPQRGRPYLEFGAAGSAGEGNHVANIRNTGNEHQHPFEAEAKAGVWHSSIAT